MGAPSGKRPISDAADGAHASVPIVGQPVASAWTCRGGRGIGREDKPLERGPDPGLRLSGPIDEGQERHIGG
jgi:hypothetical protein